MISIFTIKKVLNFWEKSADKIRFIEEKGIKVFPPVPDRVRINTRDVTAGATEPTVVASKFPNTLTLFPYIKEVAPENSLRLHL